MDVRAPRTGGGNADAPVQIPRTGKALFAWTRDYEQQHGAGLLKYLNDWAQPKAFPARMVDWNSDQVTAAYAEAQRKISSSRTRPTKPNNSPS